ncbi:hypothetical protein GBA52_025934 [Prunus armeniaca]|nr:hypothetical protein GBA52_025934 [Prunus armeniaca]
MEELGFGVNQLYGLTETYGQGLIAHGNQSGILCLPLKDQSLKLDKGCSMLVWKRLT